MLSLYGEYDVVVAGAGLTGVVAAVAAARQGAQTLLVEGSGTLGGMITGGRLTKPTGPVEGGIYGEMINWAAEYGGADPTTRSMPWGSYTGNFDPEVMQRVVIELVEEAGVEVLLRAQIVDVLCGETVRGLELVTKSGRRLVLARAVVDATGDGDVAARAGAEFLLGRAADGLTQPLTSYFRVVNVDVPRLAAYVREHPDQFTHTLLPEAAGERNEDYIFALLAAGFNGLIERARAAGDYRVPKDRITVKSGLLPGEVNVNATRLQGNALDDRTLSRAEIEVRKQAYNVLDFLIKYVPGFESAALLEVAPKLGVRETRRIVGDYLLTGDDLRQERRFPDSIGLSKAALDIHEPGGQASVMTSVGGGYTIPYRCLLPRGVEGLLVAGRCISVDEVAFASTRNTPACAQTGQAAGLAAALAVQSGTTPRQVDPTLLQLRLAEQGVPLGLE